MDSKKGHHISNNPKVALTVWWDHVGYQVRVKGIADSLPEDEAFRFWSDRNRDAQIATLACQQSKVLDSDESLENRVAELTDQYRGLDIPKPDRWGGYIVKPVSIEFLTFRDTRLHKRELFEIDDFGAWRKTLLQP